jgi:hypothetical protein
MSPDTRRLVQLTVGPRRRQREADGHAAGEEARRGSQAWLQEKGDLAEVL